MQKPCGVAVVAGACRNRAAAASAGRAYWFTPTTLLLRLRLGEAEFSDAVFVSVHTTSWLDV